jgi:hypothetical protein
LVAAACPRALAAFPEQWRLRRRTAASAADGGGAQDADESEEDEDRGEAAADGRGALPGAAAAAEGLFE